MGKSLFKLTSLNLNGIRSATTKGVEAWLAQEKPDCICVQEVKAQAPDVAGKFEELAGLKGHFHFAEKKGYSGVGVYTRHEPSDVVVGFDGGEFDAEGRYVETRFDTPSRKLSIISVYFPSGSSGPERQEAKFRFLDKMYPHLMALKAERDFIVCSDVNIAHKEADLKNWKGNLKNSGFLPEERAAACSPTPPTLATPGGATAGRPTPRTWAGVWTTTWPRPPWQRRRALSTSTRARSSLTTRRSRLATTSRSEFSGAHLHAAVHAPLVAQRRHHS
jgi:exodeoxyribonuclease III